MRPWILLLALVAAVCAVFEAARLPTPILFGGLVGALAYALLRPARPLKLPNSWFTVGQAVVGVVVGQAVDWGTLGTLGWSWLLVLTVACFSLVVSVLVGQLLMRHGVTRVTATFSSIAGGAAGLTALAEELHADSRVVGVLQYLRLLVVLVTMPLVVTLVFHARSDGVGLVISPDQWAVGLPFALLSIGIGVVLAERLHLPSAAILGPLVVAALLRLTPVFHHAEIPSLLQDLGYAVIGVQVGLRFTVASVKKIGRMTPTALLTIVVTIVACAGLGWVLTVTTGTSGLDAYLATTPGGIYAVMGTAASTGGDVTFVAAAQIVRLVIVLASAPFLSAYLRRFEPATGADEADDAGAEAGRSQ